jgi:CHASE2 domain-containing sensor protein
VIDLSPLRSGLPSPSAATKRAVLRCEGSLEEGFQVALEISDRHLGLISEAMGELPPAPTLAQALSHWRTAYRKSVGTARISMESVSVETGSLAQIATCREASKVLETELNQWLAAAGFQAIEQRLREAINLQDPVEILLRTRDLRLYQLPWHVWTFIERYPKAELVLSMAPQRFEVNGQSADQVRILAVLGDRRGIDTDADRQALQQISNAEIVFLVEPSRELLYRHLWEQSWDILFFAGHSYTKDAAPLASSQAQPIQQGILKINTQEQLSLEDLGYGLKKAIAQGLQLAIFNSCDGLGLAYELEQLHLPQLIVMREPVPDRVAQEFLKQFLQTLAAGEALHTAVRQGREWLQSLEGQFPCASWLPILFHNPAMEPFSWARLAPHDAPDAEIAVAAPRVPAIKPRRRPLSPKEAVATGLVAAGMILGGRGQGWLNQLELRAYDYMSQIHYQSGSHASEADPTRTDVGQIRVIGITKADTQKYRYGKLEENRISDRALAKLLNKIKRYQPKVVGLDIFRDIPLPDEAGHRELLTALESTPGLVAICQSGEDDHEGGQIIPSIAPPKLKKSFVTGFADSLLPDDDEVIRRYASQMKSRPGSTCSTLNSFGWSVAQQAVDSEPIKAPPRLSPNFGGYQLTSDPFNSFGADRILINYHPSNRSIEPYSLEHILQGTTSEAELNQLFNGSIVLIGYNLKDGDVHTTPIGQRSGLIVHAHLIRQLLGQTPSMRSWPEWGEALWILAAAMGGICVMMVRSRRLRLVGLLLFGGALNGVAYVAFAQAWWIPAVPVTLALLLVPLVWTVLEYPPKWLPTFSLRR